eukprot:7317373-Prymnesium_polylepis.1
MAAAFSSKVLPRGESPTMEKMLPGRRGGDLHCRAAPLSNLRPTQSAPLSALELDPQPVSGGCRALPLTRAQAPASGCCARRIGWKHRA